MTLFRLLLESIVGSVMVLRVVVRRVELLDGLVFLVHVCERRRAEDKIWGKDVRTGYQRWGPALKYIDGDNRGDDDYPRVMLSGSRMNESRRCMPADGLQQFFREIVPIAWSSGNGYPEIAVESDSVGER